MAQSSTLYIGIKGTVLAIDRATGQEIWRTKLNGWEFVNVVLEGGAIYAATSGELYCLDPVTGDLRWHNPLKGLGMGVVAIAMNQQSVALLAHKQQEDDAAAAGSTAATM
jgi:outer membrane protein assembly factor BamB